LYYLSTQIPYTRNDLQLRIQFAKRPVGNGEIVNKLSRMKAPMALCDV